MEIIRPLCDAPAALWRDAIYGGSAACPISPASLGLGVFPPVLTCGMYLSVTAEADIPRRDDAVRNKAHPRSLACSGRCRTKIVAGRYP
jgi:hypothetical protein